VILKVGKDEYRQQFRLVHEENSSFSLAERKAQYAAAMKLYTLHTSLASIVAGIADKQKIYKDAVAKLKNKKSIAIGNDYLTALETLSGNPDSYQANIHVCR